jgi:NDP-sugar pyrophosphorylase family protein
MPDSSKRSNIAGVILAAGEGRRMRPLTGFRPKPGLPVLGRPAIDIIAEKLLRSGASSLHCNLFHLAGLIEEEAEGQKWPISFYRERELLGTGGGIGNMAGDLAGRDTIILHNGDIVSNIDFVPVIAFHSERGALFTMVLVDSGPPASVTCGPDGEVTGIGTEGRKGSCRLGYTGTAVFDPAALDFFPAGRRGGLVESLREMMRARPGSVLGFDASAGSLWGEIGSPESYLGLHKRILVGRERFDPLLEPPPLPLHVSDDASVDPGAAWRGFLSVEGGAVIERDTLLEDCVVLRGARVGRGTGHRRAIVFPQGVLMAEEVGKSR